MWCVCDGEMEECVGCEMGRWRSVGGVEMCSVCDGQVEECGAGG